MASVNVKIRPEGGREVRAALLGIVRDSARARAQIRQQARSTAQAEAAAARQSAAARTQAERQSLRDVGQALRQSFSILRDVERDKRREIERTAAARKAAEERAAREATRRQREATRSGHSRVGMALGAVGIVGGIASSQIDRAQNALGVQSSDQLYSSIQASRLTFLRQSVQAGQSREDRVAAEARLREIARSTDAPLSELYAASAASQGRFSNLDDFLTQLGELARISTAYGSSLSDLQGVTGELNRQFGLTGQASVDATYAFMSAAQKGSIEAADFSSAFSAAMGQYVMSRGSRGTGMSAAMDFAAFAQVLGSGGVDADVAKTQALQLMNQLSDRRVQRRLRRAHVEVLDDRGYMRSIADIAGQAGRSPELRDPTKLREILPEAWAARALTTLISREGTEGSVSSIARSTIEGGRQNVDRFYEEFRADPLGRDAATRTEREVGIAERIPEMSDAFHTIADGATRLGTEFPILAGVAGDLTGALQNAANAALGFSAAQTTLATVGTASLATKFASLAAPVTLATSKLALLGSVVGAAVAGWTVGRAIGEQEVNGRTVDSWAERGIAWVGGQFGTETARAYQQAPSVANERRGYRPDGSGTPRTMTVELGPTSIAALNSAGAPSPGEGRRQPGGAERR